MVSDAGQKVLFQHRPRELANAREREQASLEFRFRLTPDVEKSGSLMSVTNISRESGVLKLSAATMTSTRTQSSWISNALVEVGQYCRASVFGQNLNRHRIARLPVLSKRGIDLLLQVI